MGANFPSRWKPELALPSVGESDAHERFLKRNAEAPPTAVLVFHGVGKEVQYETLGRAASLMLVEAEQRGGTGISVVIRPVPKDKLAGRLAVRAELAWTEKDGAKRQAHVYETYWAPLTMGKVSYIQTVLFLLGAGWNGLCGTVLSKRLTFQRWLFGGFKDLKLTAGTLWLILVLMAMIGIVAAVIAMAASAVAGAVQFAGNGGSHAFYNVADYVYKQIAVPWDAGVEFARRSLASIFRTPHGLDGLNHIAFHADLSWQYWWEGSIAFLLWGGLIVLAYLTKSLLVQYAGSLVAYLSPYKDSEFDALRSQIQQVGLDMGNVVLNGHTFSKWIPEYQRIIYVGHSLGSVIAYDTLNAIINMTAATLPLGARNPAVHRTPALITFGAPLDKTAFLFRVQLRAWRNQLDQAGELRETMVCAVQPLITSYENYRFTSAPTRGVKWINLWSRMDIISGHLDYYDDPTVPKNALQRVQNVVDPGANVPIFAHCQYWSKELLRKTVYDELF
jgi:hypothetical protein